MGVQIVGVNNDSMESHVAYAEKYKFTFPLLTDADGTACESYNALMDLWKLRRVMVLVGRDGRICWRHSEFRAFYRKANELREVIAGLDLG